MRILVTGGSGFLGHHLLSQLQGTAHVLAPSSKEMDIRDAQAVRRVFQSHQPEICFHLAAQGSQRVALEAPEETDAVNRQGTAHVLEAAGSGCRVVLLSSCHVYDAPTRLPVDEEHPTRGEGPYAKSKMAAEAEAFSRRDRDWVLVRPFNLTGPGQSPEFAAADWAHQWVGGAREIQTGDLDLRRDYMDVRDACEGLRILAERAPRREIFNLCTGQAVALREVFELAAPGARPIQDKSRLRAHDVPELRGCAKKAAALGWTPKIPLSTSLSDLREGLSARF
jgi:GDP-4-dehydro-6-deoxy-D-mannose reductase